MSKFPPLIQRRIYSVGVIFGVTECDFGRHKGKKWGKLIGDLEWGIKNVWNTKELYGGGYSVIHSIFFSGLGW